MSSDKPRQESQGSPYQQNQGLSSQQSQGSPYQQNQDPFGVLGNLPRTIEIAEDGSLARIIDQTKLPYELTFIDITQWERMVEAIKRLEIRGAPALGIAGAAALCLFAANQCKSSCVNSFIDELSNVSDAIATARPTAVNLSWGVRRAQNAAYLAANKPASTIDSIKQALVQEVHAIRDEDEIACRAIGSYGASLFSYPSNVLTHCNAGSLATAYYGTALGVIYRAITQGNIKCVYADETRPVGQGARLTAWELAQAGIPITLICDNMAASLMAQNKIDAVIVGADRICANGDTANKIGTYNLAVLASYHHVPFYVAAPTSTFDWNLSEGKDIEIEQRDSGEVLAKPIGGVEVFNPAFDVTPASLITSFVTEKGIVKPTDLDLLSRN